MGQSKQAQERKLFLDKYFTRKSIFLTEKII